MVDPAAADPDLPRAKITKKQTSLACKRCRGRKQKCNNNRPCDNCVRANAVCVSSERQSKTNLASPQHTRLLETRILELEAQLNEVAPEQHSQRFTSSSDQIRRSEDPIPPISIRNQRNQEQPDIPSAGPEIQTPITIRASSLDFNTPAASTGHRGLLDPPSGTGNLETFPAQVANYQVTFSELKKHNLIQTYLERVNPRYPFLHEETFLSWYQSWRDSPQGALPAEDRWKCFFIHMAFAVSLLIAAQVSPEERHASNSLYSTALSQLSTVFARPDPVLHVQAYLMCTIHALHSPSSQTVLTMISTTMRCCVVSQLHLSIYEPEVRDASSLLETQIRRRVFWSTYSIDRLISWIYHVPCSLADENIQTELFSNISDNEIKGWVPRPPSQAEIEFVPRQTQVSSALHLIRVRRIQSHILGIMMRADFEKTLLFSHGWRLHMLEELETWRRQLQPHSDPHSKGYTSQGWVGMAYNYTVLLLYRPTKENVRGMVGQRCLQACVEILSIFRQYQKDRQTAQLWPGLLSQFGIGITLLYCLWATPPACRSDIYKSPRISTTIRTCSVILAVFAEQWKQAEPLRDLFDTLSESIPFHPLTLEATEANNGFPAEAMSWIQSMTPHITSLVVNRDICRMITEMVSENDPWRETRYNGPVTAWSWDDVHTPLECHVCQSQRVSDRAMRDSWEANHELPMETTADGSFNALPDDLLSFPGLFGSVEF